MGEVETVSINELVPLLPGYVTLGDIQRAIRNHSASSNPFNWAFQIEKQLVPDILREILNVAGTRRQQEKNANSNESQVGV